MQHKGLEILVTNDDGFNSKGITIIAELLSKWGNVTVLAPLEGQSGKSSALTLDKPLRLNKRSTTIKENGNSITIYTLNGTPVDCVKMAMNEIYSTIKPNLLISGINHGSNASIASTYSGTLGAAIEGTVYGIHSIGLSLDSHNADADFSPIKHYLDKILNNYFNFLPDKGIYLNINFPAIPVEDIKGIRFTPQGAGMWINEFERRCDPRGESYFWMSGEFLDLDVNAVGDHTLIKQGYITIVPHKIDTTDYSTIDSLSKKWDLEK